MGKTFIIINHIKENLLNDITDGRSIHIVFTMNTLLNNKQFSNRLECINNDYGKNSICVFSSIYKGPYGHANNFTNLVKYTENNMPRIIIACSNKTRFSNCFNFITELAKKNSEETDVRRVFVYFDELHKYISNTKYNIRWNIENLNKLDIVSGIYGMTASPNNIWNNNISGFWSKIKIIDIKNCYNDNNYFGVNDIDFICPCKNSEYNIIDSINGIDSEEFNDQECYTINFIIKTLEKYPDILNDNSRVFIPVKNRIKTHNYIRDHLFKIRKESIIITINGREKNIKFKILGYASNASDVSNVSNVSGASDVSGEYVSIPLILNKGELGDLIVENIDKYNLHNRPIIFIGYNCVGMGQTLITEKLGNFTSAIFGYDEILNDNMYQLFGRITGRFKNWKNYNVTKVYCTLLCKHISNIMEKCAKNIAINHSNKLLNNTNYLEPFNNTNIDSFSKEEINMVKKNFKIKDYEYNNWNGPLTSIQEVEKVLTQLFKSSITIKDFINIDGYLLSKNLKKYYKKPNIDLKAINRLTIDKYTDITISLKKCISNENKTYKYIVLPVYASLDSTCVEYKLHYSI
jgi:hypothetical protein